MAEELPVAGCKNHRRKYGYYHVELVQSPVHPLSTLSLVSGNIEVIRCRRRVQAGRSLDQPCFGGQLERK